MTAYGRPLRRRNTDLTPSEWWRYLAAMRDLRECARLTREDIARYKNDAGGRAEILSGEESSSPGERCSATDGPPETLKISFGGVPFEMDAPSAP